MITSVLMTHGVNAGLMHAVRDRAVDENVIIRHEQLTN